VTSPLGPLVTALSPAHLSLLPLPCPGPPDTWLVSPRVLGSRSGAVFVLVDPASLVGCSGPQSCVHGRSCWAALLEPPEPTLHTLRGPRRPALLCSLGPEFPRVPQRSEQPFILPAADSVSFVTTRTTQ